MAASAADIRSALSIHSSTPANPPKTSAAPSHRKPEGISRELYSLIGPSTPSIAAQIYKPRLKQKPNLGGGGRVKWERRAFRNEGRSDSLELHHWVKTSTKTDSEYPFAKYNITSTDYTYSQDEYTRLLEDVQWTKEETDYLFSVARSYDCRWYIIHDRYEYPDGAPRSLEDLKDRYYSVCRKLVRNRPWAGDETSKAQLLSSLVFDKEREINRKQYVDSLESRTPEQIAEEQALFIELKRMEQRERAFRKGRDELLRTMAGINSGLADVPDDESPFANIPPDMMMKKKRKGGAYMEMESPIVPQGASSSSNAPPPPAPKRPPSSKQAAYDALHCIVRIDPPANSSMKTSHQASHLRSFKIPYPRAAVAPRVTQALSELGVSASRLVMPTRENISQLESLLEATTALVEIKKVFDKVEQDIEVAKTRLAGGRDGSSAPGGGGSNDDTMEVDEGAVGDDGREQSVLSTRSRKQSHNRSASTSSVDTSATVSTRAGTKRQKRA